MTKDDKREFTKFVLILLATFGCVGAAGVVLDPFFQYHKPCLGMPVILENAVYQTPGAARNLEYTDVIVGTSMTENFHTSWFDEELGWNTVKLSYSGARSSDLHAILSSIFSRGEPVEHVFMDMNDYQLTSPSWTSYVERPEYLYDTNLSNDYLYIYNKDVLADGWERVLDGIEGVKSNMDDAYTWEEDALFGTELALNSARDTREELLHSAADVTPLEQKLMICQQNLDNIIPFIEQNPDTEFIIYFPPYSMLYWEQVVLQGNLEDTMETYRYAINRFLEYGNVSVYYFQHEEEIITELENYRDTCHHRPEYNRYIFDCIKQDERRVTTENLDDLVQKMYEFAGGYDYTGYWQ